jgi:exodeoxyribonuclease V alpha subunit
VTLLLDPSQELAVDLMCSAPLGVVTGGPGTGKTTCMRTALDRLDEAGLTYALGSATGKASRRMTEATGRPALTLHRLLEWTPREQRFSRSAAYPIDEDVVIVDEASMLDVKLACSLLDAIQGRTRLVLVGDQDQLPPVGAGAVLADLIASGRVPVARLTTLHRAAQESWVCSQAPVILSGRVPDLRERPDFLFVEEADRDAAVQALVDVVVRRLPARGVAPEAIQVLVPQNVGRAGADVLNTQLQALLNRAGGGEKWKLGGQAIGRGDRVIQTKNVYTADGAGDVMNGETGTVTRVEGRELDVRFDDGRTVLYDRDRAEKLRLSYALSTHKSQGSEFAWVVVLVHSTHTQMLSRNLLYTAITRAKKGVVIVGDRTGVERAVKNARDMKRNTGLVDRLSKTEAQASAEGEAA